ncbi:MAG: hypothetical protein HYX32_14485 [Actinobacteria bacterium]|nr:hypothetical protein [Actinomycetota bacterium]
MKKLVLSAGFVAAMAATSLAVATLAPIELALAKGATSAQTSERSKSPRDQALEQLVNDGTISEEQRTKILDKLKKFRSRAGRFIESSRKEVAAVLGITPDQLREERRGGKSIAEVAQNRGIDPQKVIDDLVAKASQRVDEAVAAGDLPADRAAKIKSKLPEIITRIVNGKPGAPLGKNRNGANNRRPKAGDGPNGTPPSTDTSTTTAPPAAPPTAPPEVTTPRSPGTTGPTAPSSPAPDAASDGNPSTATPGTGNPSAPNDGG